MVHVPLGSGLLRRYTAGGNRRWVPRNSLSKPSLCLHSRRGDELARLPTTSSRHWADYHTPPDDNGGGCGCYHDTNTALVRGCVWRAWTARGGWETLICPRTWRPLIRPCCEPPTKLLCTLQLCCCCCCCCLQRCLHPIACATPRTSCRYLLPPRSWDQTA